MKDQHRYIGGFSSCQTAHAVSQPNAKASDSVERKFGVRQPNVSQEQCSTLTS